MLENEQVSLKNIKDNTVFCFPDASGNMVIAELFMRRNPHLPKITCGGGHILYPKLFIKII